MFADQQPSHQLLISILKQTMWAKAGSIKQGRKSTMNSQQLSLQLCVSSLAQRILQMSKQFANNNDHVSRFCLSEIQNKKLIVQPMYDHGLYQIEKINIQQNIDQYFRRLKSKRTQKIQYIYLQVANHLYIFNHCFIPSGQMDITFILSQLRMQCIMSYVQLCISCNRIIRCIMPIKLWLKIKPLYSLIWGQSVFELLAGEDLLLFPEEKAGSFDFQNSSLIFNKNMWYYDSYNVYVVIKGNKYSIKSQGIFDDEIAYTAWKKDIIGKPQYCRVIDKTLRNNTAWGQKKEEQDIFPIKAECNHYITPNIGRYKIFCSCEMFYSLPQQILKQIFRSGQIDQCKEGQIIYKSLTSLDKFYIVLEGEAKIQVDSTQKLETHPNTLKKSQCFSLSSIIKQTQNLKMNLKVQSQISLIFSIPIWKIKHILGHFLNEIDHVMSTLVEEQFLAKIGGNSMLSALLQKMVKVDQRKSQGLSQNTTKKLGHQKIKISRQLWKKLCTNNLAILFATFQDSQINQD